jgi:hypothetical protein
MMRKLTYMYVLISSAGGVEASRVVGLLKYAQILFDQPANQVRRRIMSAGSS